MKLRLIFFFTLMAAILALASGNAGAQSAPGGAGRPLRVAIDNSQAPFAFEQDGELTGFSVELWDAIAKLEGFGYEWVQVNSTEQQFQAVESGQADLAIPATRMTPELEGVIDFSHPFLNSGLAIMASTQQGSILTPLFHTIFSPALLKIMGLGLLTLLVMAHVIWFVEHYNNPAMPKAYFPGIWEAFWWSLTTIATSEYGNKQTPKSPFKRALAMFWIILGIVLIAQFTASITASLTVEQITSEIRGPEDLHGRRIAIVNGSTAAQYMEREGLSVMGVETIEEAYALLANGGADAVVHDAPILLHHVLREGQGRVQIAGSVFDEEPYAIALPAGSNLREPINDALLELRDNGTYSEIYTRWFGLIH